MKPTGTHSAILVWRQKVGTVTQWYEVKMVGTVTQWHGAKGTKTHSGMKLHKMVGAVTQWYGAKG